MKIRKKDSVLLIHMMERLLTEGKIMFIHRRTDGSIGVSLNETNISKRPMQGMKKAEGESIVKAVRQLYVGRI